MKRFLPIFLICIWLGGCVITITPKPKVDYSNEAL